MSDEVQSDGVGRDDGGEPGAPAAGGSRGAHEVSDDTHHVGESEGFMPAADEDRPEEEAGDVGAPQPEAMAVSPAPARPSDDAKGNAGAPVEWDDASDMMLSVDGLSIQRGHAARDARQTTHRLIVELKRIEGEVRSLLEGTDPKRKRKLSGTRRWLELHEDILSLRHSGRASEEDLARLSELVAQRHFVFTRLRYLSETHPG